MSACRSCGATLSPTISWCGQCLAPVDGATATTGPRRARAADGARAHVLSLARRSHDVQSARAGPVDHPRPVVRPVDRALVLRPPVDPGLGRPLDHPAAADLAQRAGVGSPGRDVRPSSSFGRRATAPDLRAVLLVGAILAAGGLVLVLATGSTGTRFAVVSLLALVALGLPSSASPACRSEHGRGRVSGIPFLRAGRTAPSSTGSRARPITRRWRPARSAWCSVAACVTVSLCLGGTTPTATAAPVPGTSCRVLPPDIIWNTDISGLPVDSHSRTWLRSMKAGSTQLHPDFGRPPYGFPFQVASTGHTVHRIKFRYASESDRVPYPFGPSTPVEQGSDRHALMINRDTCTLYELYDARWNGGSPTAGSGAVFDLGSNALRPNGWTSADAAGLPIFPGLVRYDGDRAGAIRQATRFTAKCTRNRHPWPAT